MTRIIESGTGWAGDVYRVIDLDDAGPTKSGTIRSFDNLADAQAFRNAEEPDCQCEHESHFSEDGPSAVHLSHPYLHREG